MHTPTGNLFLDSLSASCRERLLTRAVSLEMPIRTSLYISERPTEYAYFITSGMASVVIIMDDGKTTEVGVIGNEGIVGALHLLGPAPMPTDCFVQIHATALRIPISDLRNAFYDSSEIRDRVLEGVQEQTLSLCQLAACNRLHDQDARLARWLLSVQDRTQKDVLVITQEFLAEMLGSKRTTVTVVAGRLQSAGMIEYKRGKIKILDRKKLEEASCGCYHVLKNLYKKVYLAPWSAYQPIVQVN